MLMAGLIDWQFICLSVHKECSTFDRLASKKEKIQNHTKEREKRKKRPTNKPTEGSLSGSGTGKE